MPVATNVRAHAVDQLVRAIIALAEQPQLRHSLSEAAADYYLEHLSSQVLADRWLRLLSELDAMPRDGD